MTLVVNLFGGPGSGKSTTAAAVFSDLKRKGVEVELASEFAKDLTWEGRHQTLTFQPYVTVKQMFRIHRLIGQVDVVVTDSPILLALAYGGQGYPVASFERFVLDQHHMWRSLNFLIRRHPNKDYHSAGRNQTADEAEALDSRIRGLLDGQEVPYVESYGPPEGADKIVSVVRRALVQG